MSPGWSASRIIQFFSVVLVVVGLAIWAQHNGYAQIPGLSETPPPVEAPVEADERFATPRATLKTFMEAMSVEGQPDFATAAAAIDLSTVPLIAQEADGRRIANQLFDVINRTRIVNLEDVPEEWDENRWLFHEYEDTSTGDVIGRIDLRQNAIGEWKFSAETVATIPAIYDAWRTRPLVAGISGIDRMQADPGGWLRDQFPVNFQRGILGVQLWQLTTFAFIIIGGTLLGYLFRVVLFFLLRKRMDRSEKASTTIQMFARGIVWFVGSLIFQTGVPFLGAPAPIEASLLFVVKVVKALAVFWILLAIWRLLTKQFIERSSHMGRRSEKLIVPVAIKAGQFFIVVGVGIWFISQLGYNVGGILAGLGIGGLVLAFAAKDSVENFFGSLTIVLETPFTIGDWVQIGDVSGEVEQISLRSTRIRTFDDSLVTLPNSKLITSSVENCGARRYRRVRTMIGILYDTPVDTIDAFTSRIRQMMSEDERLYKERQHCYFYDMADFSLNVLFNCYVFATAIDQELAIREDLLRKVMKIAEEMGVEFAFPTQTHLFDLKNTDKVVQHVRNLLPKDSSHKPDA